MNEYQDNEIVDIDISTVMDLSEKDFEIIERTDWDSIYDSLKIEEQRILDEIDNIENNQGSDSNQQVFNLANEFQNVVVDSILGPFGLSRAMFDDKDGGAVTTQHNANKDIFAKDKEKYNRDDYDFDKKQREKIIEERKVDGKIIDQFTGKETTDPNDDHYKSGKSYHRDGGWMQSKEQRKAFGIDERNLNVIDGSLNKSLGEKDKREYETQKSRRNPDLTNKEDRGMDNRRVNAAQRRSDEAVREHAPTKSDRIKYHAQELTKESIKSGVTLALRQAVGCALKIVVEESFLVIKDAIKKYKEGLIVGFRSFIIFIIEGLKNIRYKIEDNLKKIGNSALEGGISGIISTIVTFLINSFITTIKRVVTIIREATLSLSRAIKVLCDRSVPMEERRQAAGKIILSGITACIGIFLTEAISKFISVNLPMLSSISDNVANVLMSIIVGLIGILVAYLFFLFRNSQLRSKALAERNVSTDRIKELANQYMNVTNMKVDIALSNTYQYLYSYVEYAIDAQIERSEIEKREAEYNNEIDSSINKIDKIQNDNTNKLSNLRKLIKK